MTSRPIYLAAFRGQFGVVFSYGIDRMAARAREMGIVARVYSYKNVVSANRDCIAMRSKGYRLAGLGYSLGVSALTYLQRREVFDLVICIAGSKLGINYHISPLTKRSVLWRSPDTILSGAGGDLGFDVVHDLPGIPHLYMDFSDTVVNGVLKELDKLRST